MKALHLFTLCGLLSLLVGCGGKPSSNTQKAVKVKVARVGAVQINGERGYSGTVTEESGVSLSFSTAGTIKAINVAEGQMVSAGQTIAVLDGANQSSTLASSHAVTLQARQSLKQAQDTYNRSKGLHQSGVISDAKWVQAQTALAEAKEAVRSAEALERISKKNVGDTRLTAPYAGYISRKQVEVGQNVAPGEMVAELMHIDRVKVKISVPEGEIDKIQKGEEMMVRCDAVGDEPFYGRVAEKGVDADPLSRTYDVKLLLDNPRHRLLPGMICQVYSRFQRGQTSVFVPANVVQLNEDNRYFVWVVSNGKASKRFINFVADTSQGVRVNGGLQPGDLLIVEGQQKVSEGTVCEIIK